jgi:hypothetical protein
VNVGCDQELVLVSFQLCKNLSGTVLFMFSANEFDCGFVNVGSECLKLGGWVWRR